MIGAWRTVHIRKRARIRRRDFLLAVAGAATWPPFARAQQRRVATIGFLYAGSFKGMRGVGFAGQFFGAGLAETGYVDGQNVRIVFCQARNDLTLLPGLVQDLIRREVDVIVVPGSTHSALAAVRAATTTIPIVFTTSHDPVKAGLVASLNRPGGNVTGISDFGFELSAKRFELLKLLIPGASKIALLAPPGWWEATGELANAQEGARLLGIEILVLVAGTAQEIDAAFATVVDRRADALSLVGSALFVDHAAQIVAFAARERVPTAYPFIQYVTAGGLTSYGASLAERSYLSGVYAGLILNGRKPGDLPVRRVEKFELAINLTTAKALGLAVPPGFLALADKVIE